MRSISFFSAVSLLSFLASAPAHAAASPSSEPDSTVTTAGTGEACNAPEVLPEDLRNSMRLAGVPGLSIAVIRDGKLAATCALGVADRRTEHPVLTTTLFEAASLTKPIFALGVLRLAAQGRLDLDVPLANYAPERTFPYDERYRKITARMVINHTSGLPNELPPPGGQLRLLFEPGSQFNYSGDSFQFLQQIVVHITGEPLGPWLEREVLAPLGMAESRMTWDNTLLPRMARGHDKQGRVVPSERTATAAHACCSLLTTATDYSKLLVALGEGSVIPAAFREAYFKPEVRVAPGVGWALGWATEKNDEGHAVWHWGHSSRAYQSFAWLDPIKGDGLVFLSNSSHGLSLTERMLRLVDVENPRLLEWLEHLQVQLTPTGRALLPAPDASERIDAYFERLSEMGQFSGVVHVSRGDTPVFRKAYGYANFALLAPNSVDSRFAVASITKTFTAAAVLMLAERGQLELSDPLSRFLPEFPNGRSIRLRDLLMHQGGLGDPDYREALVSRTDLSTLVAEIGKIPPRFEPGTRSEYSNSGYNVLARVIEIAGGTTYHQFLQEEIFQPLEMNDTGAADALSISERLATGYIPGPPPLGVAISPVSDPSFSIGSGDAVSTAGDLVKWLRAIREERLFARSELEYPFGWGRLGEDRKAGLSQSGLGNGFTSSISTWFEDELDVVILGNIESASWNTWPEDVSEVVRGNGIDFPAWHPLVFPPDPQILSKLEGEYTAENHRIRIDAAANSLWLYLDDWPVPKHLDATADDGIWRLRSDVGRIRFSPSDSKPWLEWIFDDGSGTRYERR